MIFDLHIHTTCSDGIFTPEQVVDIAKSKKVAGIAITDHDTVAGLDPAIRYSKILSNIIVIPGIEFGCIYKDEEVHILGYFIDYKSSILIELTKKLRDSRVTRGIQMIEKINTLGMQLSLEDVKEFVEEGYIGRPHVARAMVNRGYVNSINEAFERYLNRGKPGYVEREALTLCETINLIHKVNGIAVLAHPGLLNNNPKIIDHCIEMGIDGLEAIHSKHSKNDVVSILDICKKNDLIITGGSDFHGKKISNDYLLGKYYININDIPLMKGRL